MNRLNKIAQCVREIETMVSLQQDSKIHTSYGIKKGKILHDTLEELQNFINQQIENRKFNDIDSIKPIAVKMDYDNQTLIFYTTGQKLDENNEPITFNIEIHAKQRLTDLYVSLHGYQSLILELCIRGYLLEVVHW